MTFFRTVLLTSGLVLTACGGAAVAQQSAAPGAPGGAAAKPMLTLQMPALPDPVPVVLKGGTTAMFVLDIVDPICTSQPKCMSGIMPAVAALLARARKAGVSIVYATRAPNMSKWLPEVAPAAGDTTIVSNAQDRFYNTDLDKTLKAKGVTTLILTGWKVSGSVVYTSVGASLRDYTNVVPVDATIAATDFETAIGFFQILNQNAANLTNTPLKPKASTLSRTDMITFE
jgi:nicotinamidase-related amidase